MRQQHKAKSCQQPERSSSEFQRQLPMLAIQRKLRRKPSTKIFAKKKKRISRRKNYLDPDSG